MFKEFPLSHFSNSRYIPDDRFDRLFASHFLMISNGETMRFVTDPVEKMEEWRLLP